MQHDEVIWQIINHEFCSFKSKVAKERTFCQNPYNVTGLCIRSACPLANSRYATIREEEGVCYLYMKTIERAHTPKNLWEKIRLPANYMAALEIVSGQLEHFPKYLVHRNKQRLTKIHQMLIRMRKLKLKMRPTITTINTNNEKVERGKERKALKAAQLDRAIEKELLERLKQVSDGEIYNYPESNYNKIISKASKEFDKETDETEDEKDDLDMEEQVEVEDEMVDDFETDDNHYNVEYIEDFDESDGEEDIEETASELIEKYNKIEESKKKRKATKTVQNLSKHKKGSKVEIEYEEEIEAGSGVTASNVDYNF